MTIEIQHLPQDLVARLDKRAREMGLDRQTYLLRLIQSDLAPSGRGSGFDEILRPIHGETERRGLSQAEVERLLDEEVQASRRERRGRSGR